MISQGLLKLRCGSCLACFLCLWFLASQFYAFGAFQASSTQLNDAEKLLREGKYSEAEASLRALLTRQPSADGFDLLGYVYEQRRDLDRAETAYSQALKLNAGRLSSKTRLGIVYGKRGKHAECIAILETLQGGVGHNPEALFYLCQAYLERGNKAKALQTAELTEQWEEKDPGALLSVGRLLVSKNLSEQAVPILQKAVNRLSQSSEGYYSLALALFKLRKLEEASNAVDKARNLDPTASKILLLQALVSLDADKLSLAKDSIRKAQALKPDDKFAAYLWSRVLIDEGAYVEAIKLISGLIASGFDDPNAHLSLITALRRNGEFQKALDHALKMVQVFPGNPSAQLRAGLELEFLGNYQEAEKYLRNVLSLAPLDPEILTVAKFTLARISIKEGKDAEATGLLEDVIRANPKDTQARVELADIHHKTRQYESARKLLQDVLNLEPQNKRAHFLLAKVLGRLGKTAEAEQHLKAFEDLEKAAAGTQSEKPAIYTQTVK
jgi:tetratricopeptide (TPR) repeat protein